MNWNDPKERGALIESVGVHEYQKQLEQHWRDSTETTVNGWPIRRVTSRFGIIYCVSEKGFAKLSEAVRYAQNLEWRN
jgi:hypothetical protein